MALNPVIASATDPRTSAIPEQTCLNQETEKIY
jgi:hypothetical protein